VRRVHLLNPRAIRNQRSLGDAVGLQDLGIHLVRVEPGDESTEYHTHHCDEEFVYILSGAVSPRSAARKSRWGRATSWGLPRGRCRTR
jgi:uncharacterized cupin superfamily protein